MTIVRDDVDSLFVIKILILMDIKCEKGWLLYFKIKQKFHISFQYFFLFILIFTT